MDRNLSYKKSRNSIILVGIALMIFSWLADTVMDTVHIGERSLTENLFSPNLHDLFMRLMVIGFLLLMMIYALWSARQQACLQVSLDEAKDQCEAEKARAESVLAAMTDAVCVQDTDMKIIYQNQAHKEVMGDRLGEYCYAAFQQKDDVCEGCNLIETFRDGLCHHREASAVTAHGERHFEIFSSPIRDASGTIVAGVESVRDITERREAEEKLRLQQAAMEAAMDGIAIFRRTEGFVYANQFYAELYGYESADEILGKPWQILYPPDEVARFERDARPQFLREGKWRGELIGNRTDGSTVPLEISLTIVGEENVIAVARDIADQKRYERDNEALSKDLAERATALFVVNKELEGAKKLAEEERNKSNAIIAAMGNGVSIQSLDYKVMYQNQVHRDIVGGSFIGSYCYQTYACRDELCEGCPVEKSYKDGLIHKLIKVMPSGNHVEITASPLRDSQGEIIAGIEVVRDITHHRETEEALKAQADFLQKLIDTIPNPIFYKDAEGHYLGCNRAFEAMLNLSKEMIVGKTVHDVLPAELACFIDSIDQGLCEVPGVRTYETPFVTADGGLRDMLCMKAAYKGTDGKLGGLVGVMIDITERKQREDEIKSLNESLQQQTMEVVAANKELEAFSYTLSHDLRTPLTRIYLAAEALAEMYGELLDDNGRMLLENVCDASEQMEDLIEAILGLFSVTRSEMRAEKVNLSEIAASVSVELQMTAPERKVEFVIAQGLTASCDPDLMKVALENLLGNAWKYSRKTPNARIEFGVDQREGENVYYIRDNGAGFDMKDADKLFTPFKRLHVSRDFPGTGIGLATVQRIIERHGGRIWAEGAVDKGATFFFTLST